PLSEGQALASGASAHSHAVPAPHLSSSTVLYVQLPCRMSRSLVAAVTSFAPTGPWPLQLSCSTPVSRVSSHLPPGPALKPAKQLHLPWRPNPRLPGPSRTRTLVLPLRSKYMSSARRASSFVGNDAPTSNQTPLSREICMILFSTVAVLCGKG